MNNKTNQSNNVTRKEYITNYIIHDAVDVVTTSFNTVEPVLIFKS